jgi:hypothetical protein
MKMTKLPTLEREGETLYFLFEPRPRHPSNAITVHVMCDRRTNYEPGATAAAIQRAVNAHDDLVSALMMCRTYLSELAENDKYARDDMELVDNLLAKATP